MSRPRTTALTVLVVALALGLGSSAVLAPEADALVSISTLTVVDGSVLISHAGSGFTPAREGEVIAAGDTIRTESGAAAEITYFEGSSVRLEADTQIVVESLRSEADGGTVIGMMQTLGRTWHVVTKLISGSSRYEVHTPSSTASVRGTIFARCDGDDERGRRRPQRRWTSWGGERGARDGRPRVDKVREPARRFGARGRACDPSRSAGAADIPAAIDEDACAIFGPDRGADGCAPRGSGARGHTAEGPHGVVKAKAKTGRRLVTNWT